MKKGVKIFWGILIVVIVLALGLSLYSSNTPGKYDQLAQCIKDKGVIFYGAFWCPHCQRTKAAFGTSARLLPYVECSTPDGKDQTAVCKEKKIVGYPTWIFPDGSQLTGEHSLAEIASKSGCALPQ